MLALIPARGGSKGLFKKNIRPLNGKPLIQYTIELALKISQIDKVIVSTDDKEIADIARNCGAEVPFLRPAEFSGDTVPDRPVVLHAIDWLKENQKYSVPNILYLRCTTPLKIKEDIELAINRSGNSEFDSVRSVTQVSGVFHPYWMYKESNGVIRPFMDQIDISQFYQRQSLPTVYRLNGVVEVLRTEVVQKNSSMYGTNIGFVEIPEERSVDIDNEFEFQIAEILLGKKLHEKK